MLDVLTPEEALALIEREFDRAVPPETVPVPEALGRVLWEDVRAAEFVPDFDRSTVDGYALKAADSFGCSDAMPALLSVGAQVLMGAAPGCTVKHGECAAIPTGGPLPEGADCVVMKEYTEDYGDGTVGILQSVAPGTNLIFRGDDAFPGKSILTAGRKLTAQDIGALAALGICTVSVADRPVVGIISTGDELVPPDKCPGAGQVRDVNSPMLSALLRSFGAESRSYGIIPDDEKLLSEVLGRALSDCRMVLLSGGSSVGEKDAACRVISEKGRLLFHGLAMKPGKPLLLGSAMGKPVFGLPGHPAAAYFTARIFVRAALRRLTGESGRDCRVSARIDESVSSNQGRAEYIALSLYEKDGGLWAHPLRSKSGLISTLAMSDGYFCIERDCEGIKSGEEIAVTRD